MSEILQGLLLAAPAGLNAYIPLLLVAIGARFGWIELAVPIAPLSSDIAIAVLAVLLLVEMLVDKVPGVDHVNDVINTIVRPAAGVILFAANSNGIVSLNPVLAVVVGLLAAGSIHAVKATTRPIVNVSTAGVGAPVVSIVEDILAFVLALLALLVPLVAAIVLILALAFLFTRWRRWRHGRRKTARLPIGA